jgi:hypothetical protein
LLIHSVYTLAGSGASYGGAGGEGSDGTKPSVYFVGSLYTAELFGSGGGSGTSATADLGGTGGGKVAIAVTKIFTIDGTVSASGTAGNGTGGGGAGGSITITTDEIIGSGIIKVGSLLSFLINVLNWFLKKGFLNLLQCHI